MRKVRIMALGILLLVSGGLVFRGLSESPVGAVDFLQYWSAAQLFFQSLNPYDSGLLESQQAAVWDRGAMRLPIVMYNPPFILPFLLPLRFLSFSVGVVVWALGILVCLVLSFFLLLRARLITLGVRTFTVLFTSSSLYALFFFGQSSHILLLGFSGFLYWAVREGRALSDRFPAGLALSLTLVKPHVFFLLYVYLFVQSWKRGVYRCLTGVLCGGILLGGLVYLQEPNVWRWYLQFSQSPPISWITPTVGSWLQSLSGLHHVGIRLLPTLVIAVAGVLLFWSQGHEDRHWPSERVLYLIPFSLMFSPYGWVYDQIVLLPGILYIVTPPTNQKLDKAIPTTLGMQ